jgi:hypothetical protein
MSNLTTVFVVEVQYELQDAQRLGVAGNLGKAQAMGQEEGDAFDTGELTWFKSGDAQEWHASGPADASALLILITEVEVQV